jgi:1,2-dihydroxy-3-keto-5-methylthiopentene dioxygenase
MAVVLIPDQDVRFTEFSDITRALAEIGVDYERWNGIREVSADASDEEILEAYSEEIEKLKASGGYVAADVINVLPTTPGLEEMLNKFNKEHWHDDDEVRFIVKGRGIFHIAQKGHDIVSIEMEAGDLIRVPSGILHWFDLCGDRRIRAIRLFRNPAGWTPHYTGSGVDVGYEPVCFGPAYFPPNS